MAMLFTSRNRDGILRALTDEKKREDTGSAGGAKSARPRGRNDERPRGGGRSEGRPEGRRASSPLTAGLFARLAPRHVQCRIEGCENTWEWGAEDQIRSLGREPPERMCADHLALFHDLSDREVECSQASCHNTWTWSRGAQLAQLIRSDNREPPPRLCNACFTAERELGDVDVPCRVEGCTRTWTWGKEAQQKHRAWMRRVASERNEPASDARGSKRRSNRKANDGRPSRLCEPCAAKWARLKEREISCKVHGCSRMAVVDRESQLRAWALLGTEDVEVDAAVGKRMCTLCRDFCRAHPDRQVECGRPGCGGHWVFKTGAQLQAFLAGRMHDPIRLCGDCAKREPQALDGGDAAVALPAGSEMMPCVTPGCNGRWIYRVGASLSQAVEGELPHDRMCDACRSALDPADPDSSETQTPDSGETLTSDSVETLMPDSGETQTPEGDGGMHDETPAQREAAGEGAVEVP